MEKFGHRLMAMKTVICWSFIVLHNLFANVCEKKIVSHQPKASPHVTVTVNNMIPVIKAITSDIL